jgi:RimJ/RimL family protein N-acetyltransferase
MTSGGAHIAIRPYSESDLSTLERTLGDPKEMVHLGGPENEEKLRERHERYVTLSTTPATGCMFVITVGPEEVSAGTVGYWERDFDGQKVWETGWNVLPEFQGRGIASAATRLVIQRLTGLRSHRYLFAYPSVNNHRSNAICRGLGFTLAGDRDFEYPPGNIMHCNIWRLDLQPNANE